MYCKLFKLFTITTNKNLIPWCLVHWRFYKYMKKISFLGVWILINDYWIIRLSGWTENFDRNLHRCFHSTWAAGFCTSNANNIWKIIIVNDLNFAICKRDKKKTAFLFFLKKPLSLPRLWSRAIVSSFLLDIYYIFLK